MFHMLTLCNLAPGVDDQAFAEALDRLSRHLREHDLLHRTGRLGRRVRHPVLDTDTERDQAWVFTMTFRDPGQAERAIAAIEARTEPLQTLHHEVLRMVSEPFFTCYED